MRKTMLFWLLCVLCSPTWADVPEAQRLSEADTRSHLLCASAMVYFSPRDRNPDPGSLQSLFYHLNTLESRVMQLGSPDRLLQPLRGIKRLFSELEATPASQRERYPSLVRQLLLQQRQLSQAATQQYAQASITPMAQALNAQSQAMARLLLDYQLRRYPLEDKIGLLLPTDELRSLDKAITEGFKRLLATPDAPMAVLRKHSSSYQFVRAELQRDKGRAQGGIEFYLSRLVLDLDELATAAQPPAT